jgi:hypothetical protein
MRLTKLVVIVMMLRFEEPIMRPALPTLILLLAFISAAAQAISADFNGPDLVVRSGTTTFRLYNIADDHAFFTTVHADTKRGPDFYLVIGSSHLTRGWPPKGGNCGCGIESFILWLHVRDGKVINTQEGVYESCRSNRDGWTLGWKDGKLKWSTAGWKRSTDPSTPATAVFLNWSYDPKHPDKGISEDEKLETRQPTMK